jgi:hypothetical protein
VKASAMNQSSMIGRGTPVSYSTMPGWSAKAALAVAT